MKGVTGFVNEYRNVALGAVDTVVDVRLFGFGKNP